MLFPQRGVCDECGVSFKYRVASTGWQPKTLLCNRCFDPLVYDLWMSLEATR